MNFIFECSTRYLTSERSERVRYWVEHKRIKFISTSGHVIFCLLYKHRINSCEKGVIYYVAITRVISSRVKITYYLHVWRYEVFAGKLTWYFTGVYIIKGNRKEITKKEAITSKKFEINLLFRQRLKSLVLWSPLKSQRLKSLVSLWHCFYDN